MSKLVNEAPYHPGYEDAVVTPKPIYKGVDPAKMIWKPKPLSDEEICNLWLENSYGLPLCNVAFEYARAIEERHGIK